jgi:hypothetical protein
VDVPEGEGHGYVLGDRVEYVVARVVGNILASEDRLEPLFRAHEVEVRGDRTNALAAVYPFGGGDASVEHELVSVGLGEAVHEAEYPLLGVDLGDDPELADVLDAAYATALRLGS